MSSYKKEPLKPEDITLIVAPEIISKNEFSQIRVEIVSIKDNTGLSIREWFRTTKDKNGPDKLKIGPWTPSRKGIWIPIKHRTELLHAVNTVILAYEHKLQETL